MTWDERGRLWVAESRRLSERSAAGRQGPRPHRHLRGHRRRRRRDKVTVFADKLSASRPASPSPTAASSSPGAAHAVPASPRKGDGKADVRKVLFTGWGTATPTPGRATCITASTTGSTASSATPASTAPSAARSTSFRQGFYRFKVERPRRDVNKAPVTKLEFLRSTSNNSWGVGFSEEGCCSAPRPTAIPASSCRSRTATTKRCAACPPRVLPTIAADNHFEPITDKVRQVDCHGGFTAAAGHALYTARTYPKEYWNRVAFVAEPTGHCRPRSCSTRRAASFSRATPGTCSPATTNGAPRSRPRSGRTAMSG